MVHLIIVMALFGFLSYCILQIPMPGPIKNILIGVLIVALVLWVLQVMGIQTGFPRLEFR